MTDPLEPFRRSFFAERRELITRLGPEAFDQGQVLATCAITGRQVVLRDAFPDPPSGSISEFLSRLTTEWWANRLQFTGEAEPGTRFETTAGLYARYLPAAGYDWVVELDRSGPVRSWRVDARQHASLLVLPEDDAMFRDQTGTFFDLRAAWRAMVDTFVREGTLAVAEVQSGYIIGVRPGVPGDPHPESREDPDLMAEFSAWDPRDYDTLEFLNGPEAEGLPPAERWPEWLADHAAAIEAGTIEIFVLADSTAFTEAVTDLASARGVEVRTAPDDRLRLVRGPLWSEVDLARPYLRTLHAGLDFAAGVRAFFLSAIATLDEAFDLLTALRERMTGFQITVEGGSAVVIRVPGQSEPLGRWSLLGLVGRQGSHGTRELDEVLAFFGFDPQTHHFTRQDPPLTTCPVCGEPARVGKVVRPLGLLSADARTLAGAAVGQHFILFTRDCPRHSTPLEVGPGRTLGELEAAWRAGLSEVGIPLAAVRAWGEGSLVVGFDAGSLVLEPALLKAALQAGERPATGRWFACAFGPDAVVVTPTQLTGKVLHQARLAAEDAVRGLFPGRGWPLDVARPVDLDVEPLGQVFWTQ
jgi:hypothetical protein